MKKIPKKYAPLVGGVLMSLFMCTMMSFMMTVIFTGFLSDGFFAQWGNAFCYAFVIATPTVLVVAPIVQRLVRVFVEAA